MSYELTNLPAHVPDSGDAKCLYEAEAQDQKKASSLFDYTKPFKKKVTRVLNTWEKKLDKAIAQNFLQEKLDKLGNAIERKFSHGKVKEFTGWLNAKTDGTWYQQLALFLVKLPLKTAFNIIHMLYNLIKAICYAAVHPIKSFVKLAKMLVNFVHALTKPEVWTKIGAGILGASLGQALLVYNPVGLLIGSIIGSALLFSGISFGALEAALTAEKGNRLSKVKRCLLNHGQYLTESMLTGFVMGVITGAIQKAVQNSYKRTELNKEELNTEAEKFIKNNEMPRPYAIEINPSTQNVTMKWDWQQFDKIKPHIFKHAYRWQGAALDRLMITLTNNKSALLRFDYHYFRIDQATVFENGVKLPGTLDWHVPTAYGSWSTDAPRVIDMAVQPFTAPAVTIPSPSSADIFMTPIGATAIQEVTKVS